MPGTARAVAGIRVAVASLPDNGGAPDLPRPGDDGADNPQVIHTRNRGYSSSSPQGRDATMPLVRTAGGTPVSDQRQGTKGSSGPVHRRRAGTPAGQHPRTAAQPGSRGVAPRRHAPLA